ncbi:hypothetical protein [Streptomyces caelestis]|uniref:hypothetical protein n=1 Tax=Streptomyces caelestis TaxID=36816 RepID=UPI00161FD77C|nr:hypothetical protein [Streptomyces caelestis]
MNWTTPTGRSSTGRPSVETSGAAGRLVSALALGSGGRTLLAARSTSDDGTAEVWGTATHRRKPPWAPSTRAGSPCGPTADCSPVPATGTPSCPPVA